MRVRSGLQICLIAASSLAACGGSEPAKPAAPPPQAQASLAPADVGGSTDFGVPECDQYLKLYTECIQSKVPEAARAQVQAALDQSKQAWQLAAGTSEGKAGLSVACRQAHDAARTAMQAYGCSF